MLNEHSHTISSDIKSSRLIWAVVINVALTFAQIIGGIISGSLALIADALHNLSDAISLVIALIAQKLSVKEHDAFMTFGYKRAEVIAAFTNLITLVLVGFYLIYEGLWRLSEPQVIEGWMVIIVASIALFIDVITAFLTYSVSKGSVNIRVAFLHNVSDALASLAVIIAGVLILKYEWYFVDTLLTLLIASYVLYQAYTTLPSVINILMQGAPKDIDTQDVLKTMQETLGVVNVHHLHLWQLDEHHNALEAHVVLESVDNLEKVKKELKSKLGITYSIMHSSIEFEDSHCEVEHC
ncbi:cation transporter [Sulfurimonas sp. SAG-AH-194-L11]|nr:cation diffusion facilitator family transporter [Sulfurimonas sp. SAG-AH-194-L11]MDF1877526.1 cation transporter [Sulfurimonas sp. SAG-AH-194-L11]